jgi:hypothetical protein
LRQQKEDFGLKQTIGKTDIMLLLTLARAESFGIIANNKNACADRGWHPLNCALIKTDDLQEGARTEVKYSVSHAAMLAFNSGCALVDPASLNMQECFPETILNRMVNAALQKRQESGAHLTLPYWPKSVEQQQANELPKSRCSTLALGSLVMVTTLDQKLWKFQTGIVK